MADWPVLRIGPFNAPPDELTIRTSRELANPSVPHLEQRVWLSWTP